MTLGYGKSLALIALLAVAPRSSVAAPGEGGDVPAPAKPAAVVDNRVKESDLTTVRLTADAEKRLAIATARIERRALPRTRLFGGVVEVPDHAIVRITAPLAGTVEADAPLRAAQVIEAGAVVLRLKVGVDSSGSPLSPADRLAIARAKADLEAQAAESRARLLAAAARRDAAKLAFERAEVLLKESAGSERVVDEARAALAVSQAEVDGETRRSEGLVAAALEVQRGAAALPLASPIAGRILSAPVHPGQAVAAGALLLEIVSFESIWIRVPVPTVEATYLDSHATATVSLWTTPDSPVLAMRRVAAPPRGDAATSTLDLVFEPTGPIALAPGQRVFVRLVIGGDEPGLVVPRSALVDDASGGTWLYERIAPLAYARRRVLVHDISGKDAHVGGPAVAEGMEVVTAGVAELFGTEFGVGK